MVAPAARWTTSLIGTVPAITIGGVRSAPRYELLSVSRMTPGATVEIAGRVVTYRKVAVGSLSALESATASQEPAVAVIARTPATLLATAVAAAGSRLQHTV